MGVFSDPISRVGFGKEMQENKWLLEMQDHVEE